MKNIKKISWKIYKKNYEIEFIQKQHHIHFAIRISRKEVAYT